LRLTPTRVRQLLQGGELEGERDEAGHWLIPARAVHERLERLRRESYLEAVGYDPSSSSVSEMRDLVEELRDRVRFLEDQLQQANERDRENRRIIAALTSRIPEIEAPSEPAGERETATEQPGRVGPQPAVESTQAQESPEMAMPEAGGGPLPRDQQTPSERPWWRRVIGG
jgi:hypothetical protein